MRPEDTHSFDRNEQALVLRIGTVAAITGDTLTVDVPGGQLPDIPMTTALGTVTVGATVALLLDGDYALAIGVLK